MTHFQDVHNKVKEKQKSWCKYEAVQEQPLYYTKGICGGHPQLHQLVNKMAHWSCNKYPAVSRDITNTQKKIHTHFNASFPQKQHKAFCSSCTFTKMADIICFSIFQSRDNTFGDSLVTKGELSFKSHPKTAYLAAPATFISLAGVPILAFFLASRICDSRFPNAERRPLKTGRREQTNNIITKQQVLSKTFYCAMIHKIRSTVSFGEGGGVSD